MSQFISKWFRASTKYNILKNDANRKEKSVSFGVAAIIESIVWAVVACLCVWCLSKMATEWKIDNLSIIWWVIILIMLIALLFACLTGEIMAVLNVYYQFKLNKRMIRWFALGSWILSLVAILILVICVCATM